MAVKKSNAVTPEQAAKALAKARADQKMADQMRQGVKAGRQRNQAQAKSKVERGSRESLRQSKVAANKNQAAKKMEQAKVSKAASDFIKKEKANKLQGVKNKLKTQGKVATQSGRGYSRTGKK